ncbi:MAG: cyclic nucleotide-binding domain-containing protein [Elusimicrobia bacterium]|nr:cyclic nucleotide-binding domain-containing protein [Elusimicrobiota bacterium]
MHEFKVESKTDWALFSEALRRVDFLSTLNIGQLQLVLPFVTRRVFSAGETVCSQGAKGDAFYVVSKGKLSVRHKPGLFSFSKTVSTLGSGDYCGEMALLSNEPRSASVVCEEATELFVLTAKDFQYVLSQNRPFADEIAMIAARRKSALDKG